MAENGFFATAFRGFRKEDVLTYIDSLNAEHYEELSALQQEVATLKEENEKLTADVPAMQAELETLRADAAEVETLRASLAETEQRAAVLESKVSELEPRAAEATRLSNENAVQAEQLAAQQQQLATFEAMFGKSKDAVGFIRENVTARMQEGRAKTDKVLSAAEQTTAKLAEELDAMRARLAAARAEANAAAANDAQTLDKWLSQFENAASSGADGQFFR